MLPILSYSRVLCGKALSPSFRHLAANYRITPKLQPITIAQKIGACLRPCATLAATAGPVPSQINRKIGKWLLGCSGMVFGAVVLGGVTRLTESGLSMVDWHMFKETPPLNEDEWVAEFHKYQQFPEYKYKHTGLTLSEFKFIWYMEYIHRMWGRATGAVFLLPATYFWYRGYFKRPMKIRVGVFGLMLGFQGLLGWYMVKSGLEEKTGDNTIPRVSQHRLAFHLGTAFFLYAFFFWSTLHHLLPPQTFPFSKNLRRFWMLSNMTKGLVMLTVVSGAFVAGLGAGLTYNTFPKMADKWIPDDILAMEPKRRNFTENPTTVQFIHRILGIGTVTYALGLWAYSRKLAMPPRARLLANAVAAAAVLQVSLGITTLLLVVPVPIAAMHQAGALVLLSTALALVHELRSVRKMIRK